MFGQFVCLLIVSCNLFLWGCNSTNQNSPGPTIQPRPPEDFDPMLKKLLALNAKEKDLKDFAKTLEQLADKRSWKKPLAECMENSFFPWDEARAVEVKVDKQLFVVVIVKGCSGTRPGSDVQALILLSNIGDFCDQLSCEINSRISRMHLGIFRTLVLDNPEKDGTRLLVRLDGERARGNFSHFIYHRGHKQRFYWGDDSRWHEKGLCRIALEAGKFRVLFPTEADRKNNNSR